MNYYQARQIKSDRTWHYTCLNGNHIWSVGDCVNHPGHATKEEANECYKQFLLRERLDFGGKIKGEKCKCQVCGKKTAQFAWVDRGPRFFLCKNHLNRDEVAKLLAVDWSVSSY